MSKISYLYKTFPHLGSRYTETIGLERELKRQGKLGYSGNVNEFVNKDELTKHPVLFMRAGMAGMGQYRDMVQGKFKASIESESYYSRHGKIDEPGIKERLKDFNLLITFAESDLDIYQVPTVWMPSWVDIYKYED